MPMEYIVPSLRIAVETNMDDVESLEEHIAQLIHLEEDRFIAGFNQRVAKDRQKAQHDRHIKHKQFVEGDLVLLYENKFIKHPCKLHMRQLGPYLIHSITYGGAVQLHQLDGMVFSTLIIGSCLKPYMTGLELRTT